MTFGKAGFEAEYDTNVEATLSLLTKMGYAQQTTLHRYHCRCEVCDFYESAPLFRGQTDSSCGGEIISNIIGNHDELTEAVEALETAAVDADAKPSPRAGFHVHVSRSDYTTEEMKRRVFINYFLLEPAFLRLVSPGRFQETRDFNSRLPRSEWMPKPVALMEPEEVFRLLDYQYGIWRTADRHSTLNLGPQYTAELRLWNSTRAAWRMQLFVELSMLLMQPELTDALVANWDKMPQRYRLNRSRDWLLSVFANTACAESLERQIKYMMTTDFDALGGL